MEFEGDLPHQLLSGFPSHPMRSCSFPCGTRNGSFPLLKTYVRYFHIRGDDKVDYFVKV